MLCIGKIISTRGLKGDVKLYPYTNQPQDLDRVDKIFLGEDEDNPYKIEKLKLAKGLVILKLEGVDSIDQAEDLKNTLVYLDEKSKDLFLGNDSFFFEDLIGAEVFDLDERSLGEVVGIKKLPKHNIFEVDNAGKTWMLPNVKEFVKEIDLENMRLSVDLIEGLYDED